MKLLLMMCCQKLSHEPSRPLSRKVILVFKNIHFQWNEDCTWIHISIFSVLLIEFIIQYVFYSIWYFPVCVYCSLSVVWYSILSYWWKNSQISITLFDLHIFDICDHFQNVNRINREITVYISFLSCMFAISHGTKIVSRTFDSHRRKNILIWLFRLLLLLERNTVGGEF